MEGELKAVRKSAKHSTAKKTNNNDFNIANLTNDDFQKEKTPNKSELLLNLIKDDEFFHDERKKPFVTFKNNNHYPSVPATVRQK